MPTTQNVGSTSTSEFLAAVRTELTNSIQTVSNAVGEINSSLDSSGASVVSSKDIDLGTHDILNVGSATVGTLNYTTLNPAPSIGSLTVAETTQLENIDTTTISATQWGYLGAQDQSVATTDAVTHSTMNLSVSGGSPFIMMNDGTNAFRALYDGTNMSYDLFAGSTEHRFSTGGTRSLTLSLLSATLGPVCLLTAPLNTITSNTSTGTEGAITWDADYIYVCTATDTWKRFALDATPW